MRQLERGLSLSVLMVYVFAGCDRTALGGDLGATATPAQTPSQLQRAASGVETLQRWYDPSTGLYKTTGWWNSANATTVLVDYARTANSTRYNPVLANTFTAAQKTSFNFLNNYYDDEGWWALAWIDAYDLTGKPQYLSIGGIIFSDMAGGWDNTCGGGIWWRKDRGYKNAIANELFLSVAAHLANRDAAKARVTRIGRTRSGSGSRRPG